MRQIVCRMCRQLSSGAHSGTFSVPTILSNRCLPLLLRLELDFQLVVPGASTRHFNLNQLGISGVRQRPFAAADLARFAKSEEVPLRAEPGP
jgi:hypothetical protein